jgi:HK97 family phage prohead protease
MSRRERELRRMAMRGVPERIGMSFSSGSLEMRSKPNGTAAGSSFEFTGYAAVYDAPFGMWDPLGEPYTESVAQGACKRSLANPNLDVPFLIGHDDSGIPLARTKSGTMQLAEDTRGLHVHVPSMDGRREEVRALASAVERGDMSEMSLAFVCNQQQWDDGFEHRTVMEMDLHRGDVCAVTHGANAATAGISMFPVEQLAFRRPAAIGGPALLERRASAHGGWQRRDGKWVFDPDNDGDDDSTPSGDSDHDYWSADGRQLKAIPPDPDGKQGKPLPDGGKHAAVLVSYELLSVPQAERDKAHAAGNSLPDKSYPINNIAQLHSAAVLAASHHGDWKAAQALIRRRAKELGVDVTTLAGFGEAKAAGLPVELRASAAEDSDLSFASDYDAAAAPHAAGLTCPQCKAGNHGGSKFCNQCGHNFGTGATVTVDDPTGIPGEEVQMAAARKLELLSRELELEELAAAR